LIRNNSRWLVTIVTQPAMQLAFVGRFRCHYDFTLLVKQFKSVAFNFDCHFHVVLFGLVHFGKIMRVTVAPLF